MGILTTIAVSMVSLATLVLTITMVVVQLAMGQFSPRIVQTFLRDKPSQLAIGLFVATFAHAMVAMREVQFDGDGQVPGVAIAVCYLLVLTQHRHVGHLRRSHRPITSGVGLDRAGRQRHPPAAGRAVPELHRRRTRTRPRRRRGTEVGRSHLDRPCPPGGAGGGCRLRRARRTRTRAASCRRGRRSCASRATGTASIVTRRSTRCGQALERTLDEDVAYGFRMLVDMAERSLSDSPFLDPTTAVQAIDRLHDGLRQLAVRELPDGRYYDGDGSAAVDRCRRWTGTPTCIWPSTRSASPVHARHRSARRLIGGLGGPAQRCAAGSPGGLELQLKPRCDGSPRSTRSN